MPNVRTTWPLLLASLVALSARAGAPAPESPAPAEAVDPLDGPDPLDAPEAPPPRPRSSISEELGTQQPSSSPSSPAAASYSNNLSGVIGLDERWSLQLGFLLTLQKGAPPPPGSNFGSSGGHVSLFSLGADWDSGDHWSLGLSTDLSPKSSNQSSTSIDLNSVLWSAQLASTSSNAEVQLNAAYDTNGDSNAEWLFAGALTGGHLDSSQSIDAVENPVTGRTRTPAELKAACAAHTALCRRALIAALQDRDDPLDSLKLNLGATLTLFDSTDVGLSGDGYLYAQDPSQVGYFNVAKGGRSASGGGGVPIAPLRYDGRADLVHRFGPLSIKLWASAGEYAVESDGITYGFGARVQYKFSHAFRVWISSSLQHDVDDTGDDITTWSAALGAQLRL